MSTAEPGTGKRVATRLLAHRFERTEGLRVAVLTHPCSKLGSFYREMGDLFSSELMSSNRWGGLRGLRERWLAHLDDTRMRPLLLVDEAQELPDAVLAEDRLLAATDFDSRGILNVVFAGDSSPHLPSPLTSPVCSSTCCKGRRSGADTRAPNTMAAIAWPPATARSAALSRCASVMWLMA